MVLETGVAGDEIVNNCKSDDKVYNSRGISRSVPMMSLMTGMTVVNKKKK